MKCWHITLMLFVIVPFWLHLLTCECKKLSRSVYIKSVYIFKSITKINQPENIVIRYFLTIRNISEILNSCFYFSSAITTSEYLVFSRTIYVKCLCVSKALNSSKTIVKMRKCLSISDSVTSSTYDQQKKYEVEHCCYLLLCHGDNIDLLIIVHILAEQCILSRCIYVKRMLFVELIGPRKLWY